MAVVSPGNGNHPAILGCSRQMGEGHDEAWEVSCGGLSLDGIGKTSNPSDKKLPISTYSVVMKNGCVYAAI